MVWMVTTWSIGKVACSISITLHSIRLLLSRLESPVEKSAAAVVLMMTVMLIKRGNEVRPHRFQMKRWTVSARFLPAPRSGLWNTWRTIAEVELKHCLLSPRYLPFWSCPAWRLAKHNLSGLLNSVTWRKKTPVASQLRPLWGEKSAWQALNCCNAVWPTLIPNEFLPWLRSF